MMDEDRREMIQDFVTESRDLLDEIEPQIIELEQVVAAAGKIDEKLLNAIFRLFHTVKGSASFLDLQAVIQVTHEAETLLDYFRTGQLSVTSEHVDLLCRVVDFIRKVLDQVESKRHDRGFEEAVQQIVDDLVHALASVSSEQILASEPEERDGKDPNNFEITPELVKRFVEEALDLCGEAEYAVLAMEHTADSGAARRVLRAFHSLKGNAAFLGYPCVERVSHLAETIVDSVISGEKDSDGVVVTILLTLIDALRGGIRRIEDGQTPEIPDLQQVISFTCQALDMPEEGDCSVTLEENKKAEEEVACEDPVNQNLLENSVAEEKNVGRSGDSGPGQVHPCGSQTQAHSQFIRVDTTKLDQLLDLVGELVIAEAMVASQSQSTSAHDQMEKAIRQLDKITNEMQEVALSLRMVPLTAIFRKMVRLIRDLAQREKKQVELEIRGADTEVDKTVIELISDPLVHLIRNAVDHGIENPAMRRAAGKPEVGQVVIEARYSAGEVWIIVQDDGRGLDKDRIIEKGLEKGIITDEEGRNIKDDDVWQLIFAPGFSTAEEVSDISGRGVGMDVVRNNVEKLRGRVEVHSTCGCGTAFVIRIPLTLAIIEGMIIKVGQCRYTIPISSIKEIFQVCPSMITCTSDGLEVVRLRGELLPVLRLHELYKVVTSCRELSDGILIAVQNNDQKCCLFVDELVGQQQIVIKGLPDYLEHVRGISGCAILSNGSVSLILDVAGILECSQSDGLVQ